jgi:hypothetical protein
MLYLLYSISISIFNFIIRKEKIIDESILLSKSDYGCSFHFLDYFGIIFIIKIRTRCIRFEKISKDISNKKKYL